MHTYIGIFFVFWNVAINADNINCNRTYFPSTILTGEANSVLVLFNSISYSWSAYNRFYAHTLNVFGTDVVVRCGLLERCEKQVLTFPAPGGGGKIDYTQFNCRPFPSRQPDKCEGDNRSFCTLWWTAGYSAELSVVFGTAAALGLVVGVTTGSRRRRVWRAVAILVALHGMALFHSCCSET